MEKRENGEKNVRKSEKQKIKKTISFLKKKFQKKKNSKKIKKSKKSKKIKKNQNDKK